MRNQFFANFDKNHEILFRWILISPSYLFLRTPSLIHLFVIPPQKNWRILDGLTDNIFIFSLTQCFADTYTVKNSKMAYFRIVLSLVGQSIQLDLFISHFLRHCNTVVFGVSVVSKLYAIRKVPLYGNYHYILYWRFPFKRAIIKTNNWATHAIANIDSRLITCYLATLNRLCDLPFVRKISWIFNKLRNFHTVKAPNIHPDAGL